MKNDNTSDARWRSRANATSGAWGVLAALTLLVAVACGTDSDTPGPGDTSGRTDAFVLPDLGGMGDVAVPDQGSIPPDVPPTSCQGPEDCPVARPFCDEERGVCVQCRTLVDCLGARCIDGVCEGGDDSCEPDTRYCDGPLIVTCGPDGKPATNVDCTPNVCFELRCAVCVPGTVQCQADVVVRCNARGTGWDEVERCTGGAGCYGGQCLQCRPRTRECDGDRVTQCRDDGSGFDVIEDCAATGFECRRGMCFNACAIDPKNQTNAGCDFWAVDLDNAFVQDQTTGETLDARNAQFAVIVSNTSPTGTALVTVTFPDGREEVKSIGPLSLETFLLPPDFGILGTSVTTHAFRIRSTRPVTCYQFNPLENVGVFSNDASVLLPVPSFGTDYFVPALTNVGFPAYAVVVATEDDTRVTVYPTVATKASTDGRVPAIVAGGFQQVTLAAGEVLSVEDDARSSGISGNRDMSGSRIVATKPVAVFGGMQGAVTGAVCCADHIEQQLLPTSRWGKRYIATRSFPRDAESDHWLVLASQPNTTVTVTPAITGAPTAIQPSTPYRFTSREDFVIDGDKPFLLVQFLASSQEIMGATSPGGQPCTRDSDCGTTNGYTCESYGMGQSGCEPVGDPAMILAVPVAQYRTEYVFLTPSAYAFDYLNVVAPTGATITLDGRDLAANQFTAVGSTGFAAVRMRVQDGVHVITGTAPFGIVVYGYDDDVSYGYPGGLGLEDLTVPSEP